MVTVAMKSEDYCFLAGKLWQTYKVCWEAETWLPTKACMVTVVSPVITYGCEGWTVKEAECQKNWWLRAVVLQKTPECPLYSKEIKPVNIKGDQLWTLEGLPLKPEAPVFWPPNVKSWFIGKVSDAGKDWGQKKRASEDEMAGWHHWLDGYEFE